LTDDFTLLPFHHPVQECWLQLHPLFTEIGMVFVLSFIINPVMSFPLILVRSLPALSALPPFPPPPLILLALSLSPGISVLLSILRLANFRVIFASLLLLFAPSHAWAPWTLLPLSFRKLLLNLQPPLLIYWRVRVELYLQLWKLRGGL
jgi:hypothetical protein